MIKNLASSLLPLANMARSSVFRGVHPRLPVQMLRGYPTIQFNYFSTQNKHQGQKQPPKQKEEQVKVKTQQKGKNGKKLSELSNQQLIDLNTEQSLKIVHDNIKKMQERKEKQAKEIKQLEESITFMDKSHNQSATKQEQLLENIKMQQQQLQRIKKRADKEIQDSKDFAITKIAKQLLQVADSIKRCKIMAEQKIKADPNSEYLKKIIDVNNQMKDFFKLYDIQQFDPTNQPFDPNLAQGLVTIPTPPGYQKNNVATTMMTGYKIKSRLLRSAKVGIFV